jgi:hypothetical protein
MSFISDIENLLNTADENYQNDEWYFSKFKERSISIMEPYKAFDCINIIIPVLLNKKYDRYWSEVFGLLFSLVWKSNTTEIPSQLLKYWDVISDKSSSFGDYDKRQFDELARYYRKEITCCR